MGRRLCVIIFCHLEHSIFAAAVAKNFLLSDFVQTGEGIARHRSALAKRHFRLLLSLGSGLRAGLGAQIRAACGGRRAGILSERKLAEV